jgi:hypothetical protein
VYGLFNEEGFVLTLTSIERKQNQEGSSIIFPILFTLGNYPISERVQFPDVFWFQRRQANYNKDENPAEENRDQKQTGHHQYLS